MKHQSIINKIEKLGLQIAQPHNNNYFEVMHGDHIVSWYRQDERAVCVHCTWKNDGRDSMTDYFPGHFARTIKAAVEYLKQGAK